MTDLTAAVEAARVELIRRIDADAVSGYRLRNYQDYPDATYLAGALVAAAAPILRAQVLAQAREAVDRWEPDGWTESDVDQRQGIRDALAAIDALGAEGAR